MTTLRNKQTGLGFFQFIMIAVMLIIVVIFGMKLIPPYMHDAQIKRIFQEITSDPAMKNASIHEIKMSYIKRASINYITDITAEDIVIEQEEGRLRLSASYTVKLPIGGNAFLLLEFNPSSS